jgi:hypothetical protein
MKIGCFPTKKWHNIGILPTKKQGTYKLVETPTTSGIRGGYI